MTTTPFAPRFVPASVLDPDVGRPHVGLVREGLRRLPGVGQPADRAGEILGRRGGRGVGLVQPGLGAQRDQVRAAQARLAERPLVADVAVAVGLALGDGVEVGGDVGGGQRQVGELLLAREGRRLGGRLRPVRLDGDAAGEDVLDPLVELHRERPGFALLVRPVGARDHRDADNASAPERHCRHEEPLLASAGGGQEPLRLVPHVGDGEASYAGELRSVVLLPLEALEVADLIMQVLGCVDRVLQELDLGTNDGGSLLRRDQDGAAVVSLVPVEPTAAPQGLAGVVGIERRSRQHSRCRPCPSLLRAEGPLQSSPALPSAAPSPQAGRESPSAARRASTARSRPRRIPPARARRRGPGPAEIAAYGSLRRCSGGAKAPERGVPGRPRSSRSRRMRARARGPAGRGRPRPAPPAARPSPPSPPHATRRASPAPAR